MFMKMLLFQRFSLLICTQLDSSLGSLFTKRKKIEIQLMLANTSYFFPYFYILESMQSTSIYIQACLEVKPKKYLKGL